ncbi:PPK2 family polyphosphate kinase [Tengunoibacter tsumagoiensis]|uniref:PPK2 family polyphosphate--nucleotide phosphotransferase n=1 Tax=Tengunoibacter tsumagoiensis TaxID=2014871 RepID=A0A402A476_9CHLR|nr:PPK2 family polyphosphate kinase [Tengunoibacter tsumagoiensis]GCE13869.1 PPK2 family polyphosphate--nucleotide phosphotransferase [Tengunoibacter tsumagoiensis]
MSSDLVWKIAEDHKVKLKDYDPDFINKHVVQEQANAEMERLDQELSELQELLAAAQQNSLLMILQGMDTSGKDGTIRHVFSRINPQGCYVHSFKQPTDVELAHDFLWRVHTVTPGKGMMGIFNRSHYEDVLVVRVHDLVPEDVWSKRYKAINQFEKLLVDNNTIIIKFFLHISKDEQARRLEAREQDKDKAWKLSASDWAERKYWDDYQKAYEDVLSKCSTEESPWYIVPSNHKWYRNLVIAQTLVQTLRPYKDQWRGQLEARGRKELELLAQQRQSKEPS